MVTVFQKNIQNIYITEIVIGRQEMIFTAKKLPEPFLPRIHSFNIGWYKRDGTIEGSEITEAFVSLFTVLF